MWTDSGLREIRAFLALAEELHFGRAADRVGVTHARISQTIRVFETRIGGRLFERTSRRVRLTPLGTDLAARLRPAHAQLLAALEAAATGANEIAGTLRVGVTVSTNRPAVARLVEAFRYAHPECHVAIEQVDLWQPYDALRCGEVDVLCQYLAADESDLTVGPVIERCERVLVVGTGHRLASRVSVSIEELAGERLNRPPRRFPRTLGDAILVPRTPSGRPIRRTEEEIESTVQVATLVAAGEIVTLSTRETLFDLRDDLVQIPVSDLPPLPLGLIWSTAHETARIRAFSQLAARCTEAGDQQEDRATAAAPGTGDRAHTRPRARPVADLTRVEMHELRAFLILAEELHFGRSADRLGITQSRMSQTIKTLEARIGAKVFVRTSRTVRLTPLGQRLLATVKPAYRQLRRALEHTHQIATGVTGTLRIGTAVPTNSGRYMVEIVHTFERRHPGAKIALLNTGIERNYLHALRAGEVDMLATRLPLTDPDITVGPILTHEQRVLLVAQDDPLAGRDAISYEEIAERTVADLPALPREMIDAVFPPLTPSGKPLRRTVNRDIDDVLMGVALGEQVHPSVRSVFEYVGHPGITSVPITDLPPSQTALAWLTANRNPAIEAFADAAAEILSHTELAPHQPPPKAALRTVARRRD